MRSRAVRRRPTRVDLTDLLCVRWHLIVEKGKTKKKVEVMWGGGGLVRGKEEPFVFLVSAERITQTHSARPSL